MRERDGDRMDPGVQCMYDVCLCVVCVGRKVRQEQGGKEIAEEANEGTGSLDCRMKKDNG